MIVNDQTVNVAADVLTAHAVNAITRLDLNRLAKEINEALITANDTQS